MKRDKERIVIGEAITIDDIGVKQLQATIKDKIQCMAHKGFNLVLFSKGDRFQREPLSALVELLHTALVPAVEVTGNDQWPLIPFEIIKDR